MSDYLTERNKPQMRRDALADFPWRFCAAVALIVAAVAWWL
ncbi:hypothetical protein [Sulfitobacter pacificus]